MSILLSAATLVASLFGVASAHPHPDLPEAPVCVAHRGVHWCTDDDGETRRCDKSERVENSRAAIETALAMRVPGIEFDVRHSRDGVPVVLHGRKVKRVAMDREDADCRRRKRVSKQTWDELDLSCELKSAEDGEGDHGLWRLQDALETLDSTGRYVFVELKDGPSRQTLDLLEAYQRHNQQGLVVLSFRQWRLKAVREHFEAVGVPAPALIDLGFFTSGWADFDGGGIRHGLTTYRTAHDVRQSGRLVDVWTLRGTPSRRLQYKVQPDFVTTNNVPACYEAFPAMASPWAGAPPPEPVVADTDESAEAEPEANPDNP